MTRERSKILLNRWIELWNGNLLFIDEIVGPEFVGHFPPTTSRPNEVHGSQALEEWIRTTLALFVDVQLTLEVGPLVDKDVVVGRWIFRGIYQGGISGAASTDGTQIAFGGIDILRIADEKIVEYWVSSDGLYLMQQLGVVPSS
jgi:predicted ester cyclase